MFPSPAASLAILLMMGETLVGPYSWILGRQFWYASTTPWIPDQKEHRRHGQNKGNINKASYTCRQTSNCKLKDKVR